MLCEVCDGLELSADDFFVGKLDRGEFYDDFHNLGTVCNVRHRASECSLCRIALETVGLGEVTDLHNVENEFCQLYWQSDGFLTGDEEPKVRCLRVSVKSLPLSDHELHRICLLGVDALQGTQRLFFGRRVPDKIDVSHVQSWIRRYQKWHGDNCKSFVSRPNCSMPTGFRVLDTWDRCIVSEPPRECVYLALS